VKTKRLYQQQLHHLLILFIILGAAWLRWWQLNEIPPGLWFDEAYNGMDALWMLGTRSTPIFLEGNNGREPLYHYLLAPTIGVLGAKAYTMRLVSAIIGIITIALFYRWSKTIFYRSPNRYWLALFSAAGLAFSFWHVVLSRNVFRTILVPSFVILTGYFFWLGVQRRSLKYFALAGLALGLGQYSYLSFRLLPFVLVLFVAGWTLFGKDDAKSWAGRLSSRRRVWLGLLITALITLILVLPLGLYFVNNADKFLERSTQVSIWSEIEQGKMTLTDHLLEAVSVFGTGADPNWRHDLPTHTAFGWLMIVGFWLGLMVSLRRFRRSQHMFLLIGLVVMWLPGLLSTPAAHALRLSGLLPFYYLIAGIGFVETIRFIGPRLQRQQSLVPALNLAVFGLIVVWSGGSTAYDYFWRWANQPNVYEEYKGHLAELTDYLIEQAENVDILIPFPAYNYPSTRFLLHDTFHEMSATLPPLSTRPVLLVNPAVGRSNWGNSPAYVWLTKAESGQGVAYVSLQDLEAVLPLAATAATTSFRSSSRGLTLAALTPLENIEAVRTMFFIRPSFTAVDFNWLQEFQLIGYQLVPDPVQPGQTLDVNLFWRAMARVSDWDHEVIVEIYSGHGDFVSRSEFSTEKLLNWREEGVEVSARRLFFISPELPPGPYVLRLKIQWGGSPVPAVTPDNREVSEVTLGIFYVADGVTDPRQPPVRLNTRLDQQIELLGYAPPVPLGNNVFRGKLYWQAVQKIPGDFTPFVYLVDPSGQIVSRWEAAPLAGQYPTSRWQPTETVVDEFDLALPQHPPAGEYRLVAGMVDPGTGLKLPAFAGHSTPLPDNMVTLSTVSIP
jgi:4-amino-4-deoxy-L-arabinose transferase-like glycosyltransferase